MSQHMLLVGAQILRLNALARACEHIAGAKLMIHQTATQLSGTIALADNPLIRQACIPSYTSTLHLRFQPQEGAEIRHPVVNADGVIENGALQLTIDVDHRQVVESVIGANGEHLMRYYKREVGVDTVCETYGRNFDFVRSEQIVNGVPVLGLTATERQETATY